MSFTATEENPYQDHLSSAVQAWQGGTPAGGNEYRPASVTDMLKSWKAKNASITGNTRDSSLRSRA